MVITSVTVTLLLLVLFVFVVAAAAAAAAVVVVVIIVVSCHRPFHHGTALEPTVNPTAQASSFRLQYSPYYA
jgi:hypothetical protein